MEGVDEAGGGLEDVADAEVEVGHVAEVEDIHGEDGKGGVGGSRLGARSELVGLQQAVAEDAGAGVDAENEHG